MLTELWFTDCFLCRWAYALYSSCGSLDIECTEKLSIGELKRMLCVPVLLSMRGEVENSFDKAWLDLSMHDTEAILMAQHPPLDPDDLRITHKMFRRILMETKFSRFMVKSTSFGKKGSYSLISQLSCC